MPRYLTRHNIACLTRQGARQLAEQMRSSPETGFLRVLVSLTDGHLIAEFEVASREVLEQWMEKSGFHYEWMSRIDLEATREEMRDL
jgi:hypothetical protein